MAVAALALAAGVGTGAAANPDGFGRPRPKPAPAPTTTTTTTTPGTTSTSTSTSTSTGTGTTAGSGGGNNGNGNGSGPGQLSSYTSTATYPAGSLLARAQANPKAQFTVIIQVGSDALQNGMAGWAGMYGRLKHSLRLIGGVSVTLPGWAILYVAEHPQIFGPVSITEDAPVTLLPTSAAPTGSGQHGPSDWQASVGADQLWSHAGYVAPPAPAIAVVDSGIDPTKIADFGSRIVARVNFASDNATGDPEGHGTMVAGIAAGAANPVSGGGVAQDAPLVDLRVADSKGQARTSDVIAALDWVLQNKSTYDIRVVNLSLDQDTETSIRFDPLDAAVERLWLNGVVVVTAVGNNGSATGPSQIGAPANDPFVITVGAVDTNGTVAQGDDFRGPWSAYGYTADGFLKPELSAPGRYMVAPTPDGSTIAKTVPDRMVADGYWWMSGTSYSAPVVAGAAAQLLALHPSWTPDQVKGALMASAAKLAGPGAGIGEVNLLAASKVASPPNPNDILDSFLTTDPSSGLVVFDPTRWTATASTNASWTSASWTSASWTSASWTAASWTSASWTAASWTAASWTEASWAE